MINLFKKIIGNKRYLVFGLVITTTLFLLVPKTAQADILKEVSNAIAWLIGQLNYFIGFYILVPLINFVVQIIEYNGFLDSYAVQIGWPLVRDLSNMFFVIILLIIAFSTILHISSYHYKNTLLKLVIMALLINFSKTILGFVIDFAQVIMLTFVSAFKQAAVAALSFAFGINKMGEYMVDFSQGIKQEDTIATVMLNLVFLVVACAVMLAYAAVLLYRIISLWILVILSPFAFFAAAFPGLKKYSSEYWQKFFTQLTVGIMMAFCLWLAFMIMAAGVVSSGQTVSQQLGLTASPNPATQKLWEHVYTFIISIALLLLGLQYAQQAGGFAGAFAGKVSGKLSDWGSKAVGAPLAPFRKAYGKAKDLAKFGVKRGLGLAERKLLLEPSTKEGAGRFAKGLKYLTKAGWDGWLKRGDNLLDDSRQVASGAAHDDANKVIGKIETSHQLLTEERIAKKKAEELGVSGLEDLKFKFDQAMFQMKPGAERDRMIQGLFAVASKEAWVDDLMTIPKIMEELMTKEEKDKLSDLKEAQKAITASLLPEIEKEAAEKGWDDEERKEQLDERVQEQMLAETGQKNVDDHIKFINREKSGKFLEMVATDSNGNLSQSGLNLIYSHEQNAKANGHYEDVGYSRVDEKTGRFRMLDFRKKDKSGLTEADRMGLTEVSKLDPSQIVKMQAHSAGPRRLDGTNAPPEEYHQNLQRIAGRSNEAYRLNPNGRTSNVSWGGTAVESPIVEEKGAESAIINFKTAANLETGLSTANTDLNFAKATYFKAGADFVDEKGNAMNFRDGSQHGFMVFRHKDEKGNIAYRSIDSKGGIHEVEKKDGKYVTATGGEKGEGERPLWETVDDFAKAKGYKNVVKRLGEEEMKIEKEEETSQYSRVTKKSYAQSEKSYEAIEKNIEELEAERAKAPAGSVDAKKLDEEIKKAKEHLERQKIVLDVSANEEELANLQAQRQSAPSGSSEAKRLDSEISKIQESLRQSYQKAGLADESETIKEQAAQSTTQSMSEIEELTKAIQSLKEEISELKGTLKPEALSAKEKQMEGKQRLLIKGNLQLAMRQQGLGNLSDIKNFNPTQRRYLFEQFRKNTDNLRKLQSALSKEMHDKLTKDLEAAENNLVSDQEFTNFFNNYGVS